MLWKNREKRYSLAETENMGKMRHRGSGVLVKCIKTRTWMINLLVKKWSVIREK
jgi:hypothetical protein